MGSTRDHARDMKLDYSDYLVQMIKVPDPYYIYVTWE